MKKLLSSIFAIMAVCTLSAQSLPDVKVETADGREISVRSLTGKKPLIISFWAITCKPCIQELNAINDSLDECVVDADGNVVFSHSGYTPGSEQQLLDKVIEISKRK